MEGLTAEELLERSLVGLGKYINLKNLSKPDEVTRAGLICLVSDLFDYTGLEPEITIESKGCFCALCEQYIRSDSDKILLNCSEECYCCGTECLRQAIEKQRARGWHLIYETKCNSCSQLLPRSAVHTFYDEDEVLRLADEAFREEKRLNCKTCTEDYPASDMITLVCNHRFCKDCMIAHLMNLVQSGLVIPEKTICPEVRCGQEIEEVVIESLLDRQSIDIIHRLRRVAAMESMKTDDQKVL